MSSNVQQKIGLIRKSLHNCILEHEEEVDLALTALISSNHLLLTGPPGTAKSFLLENVLKPITGAKYFSWLMGKFTEPNEIFGPVDILALKQGKSRVIITNKLPEAHIAFLDEFWKSSTAIANTLLKITNEGYFNNGDGDQKVPLRVLVAGSNEYPQDGELGAMFDRFILRKEVKYVSKRENRKKLLSKMNHTPVIPCTLSLEELDQASKEAMNIPGWEDVMDKVMEIVDELIKEGIRPSDRRLPKTGSVVRAYAYVMGANKIEANHLEVLAHMLWNDPTEQPKKCAEIVSRIANPIGMKINGLLGQVEDILVSCSPVESVPKLKSIQDELKKLSSDPRRDQAILYVQESIKERYDMVLGLNK